MHSMKTPTTVNCYFHMEILDADIWYIVYEHTLIINTWIIYLYGCIFYDILDFPYSVIQIPMQMIVTVGRCW